MNEMQTPEDKAFRLGVLLVHGIGTQPTGETLVRWGDVLLKTINRATGGQVYATAQQGRLTDRYGTDRAEMSVRLESGLEQEHWLVSEGWWARSFPAPSYGELVSWSVRALPWLAATHIAHRWWIVDTKGWSKDKVVAFPVALGQLLFAFAVTPLFLAVLAIVMVLGLAPIPQLRTFILNAQSALSASVGDSLAFVESPVRAALIRTRILDALERLRSLCDRTVIVAHSQGAAAVLDALEGIVDPGIERDYLKATRAPSAMKPNTLVTFGSGVNQLVSQKVLSRQSERTGPNPASVALVALAFIAGSCIWLYSDIAAVRTTVANAIHASWQLLVFLLLGALVLWAANRLITLLEQRWDSVRKNSRTVKAVLIAGLVLVAMLFALYYAEATGLPVATVAVLMSALSMLALSMRAILSDDMKRIVTEPVRRPPGLDRWVDIYASSDPVPNGPTRTVDQGARESVEIFNVGSMFGDHTRYWKNVDGFVLRVVRICAETAGSQWHASLPAVERDVDARAKWRMSFLRLARRCTGAIWLMVGLYAWMKYGNAIVIPFSIPKWAPPDAVHLAALAAAVGIAGWTTNILLETLWRSWVRAEEEEVLAQKPYANGARGGVVAMVGLVLLLLMASLLFMREGSQAVQKLVDAPGDIFKGLLVTWIFAVFSTNLLFQCKKPPPDANGDHDGKLSKQVE